MYRTDTESPFFTASTRMGKCGIVASCRRGKDKEREREREREREKQT